MSTFEDYHLEKIKSQLIDRVLKEKEKEESFIADFATPEEIKVKSSFDPDEVIKNYAIDNLLKLEKVRLDNSQKSDSESDDDKPLALRLTQGKWKISGGDPNIPQINRHKLRRFLDKTEQESKRESKFAQRQKELSNCKCRDCINVHAQKKLQHWNSPSVIMKAIRHSLLTRKWSNVTKLLLMLIPHGVKYQSYISEVCKIIEDMNPLIAQNPELSKQFDILRQLYSSKQTAPQDSQLI